MRFISSIYASCALVWAVYASPVPVPQQTGPSDSVKRKDPVIRSSDVFQPIEVVRAPEIDNDIEGRDNGGTSGANAGRELLSDAGHEKRRLKTKLETVNPVFE
ncbi:hypothetical protein B0H14DRAFT_2639049 [Mycena olivaceomarginata]|nr:hypothetical protein B0H14DRAFT_2639049 [Mycena olivaceomarginata]